MKIKQIINNMITYDKKPCKPFKWIIFPIVCFMFLLMFTIGNVKPVKAFSTGLSTTDTYTEPFTFGFDSINVSLEQYTNLFSNITISAPPYAYDILNNWVLNSTEEFRTQYYADFSLSGNGVLIEQTFSQTGFLDTILLDSLVISPAEFLDTLPARITISYDDFLLPTSLNSLYSMDTSVLNTYDSTFYDTYIITIPNDLNNNGNFFVKFTCDIAYVILEDDTFNTYFYPTEVYFDSISNINQYIIDDGNYSYIKLTDLLMSMPWLEYNVIIPGTQSYYFGEYFTYFSNFELELYFEDLYDPDWAYLLGESRYYVNYQTTFDNESFGITPIIADWYSSNNMPNIVNPTPTPVDPIDMSSWLLTSIGAFMNAELFPGFALGGILAVLVAFPIVIWFLKLLAGG